MEVGVENPFEEFNGPEEVAVGLLNRLVSKGDEGVAAGGSGVELLPEVTVLTSLVAEVFGSRISSELTSILS